MSNYVKSTNFTTKDTLTSGDPNKIVKGTEIDTEFIAIASAIASKSDLASPAFTGVPTAPTAAEFTNTAQVATAAFVQQELNREIDALGTMSVQDADDVEITGGAVDSTPIGATTASTVRGTTITATTGFVGNLTGNASTVTNGVYTTNFTGSNQSLGTNGYQKLPGGLIMQWGSVYIGNLSDNASATFSYPITFPSTVIHAYVTFFATDNSQDFSGWITSQGNSSCSVNIQEWSGSGQNITAKFFVIGY
jgi:hypothetical protein